MNQDQTELLHRVFAVNEQIVKQNYQIMMVLTQPTISRSKGTWLEITQEDIEFGLTSSNHVFANAGAWRDGVEWAIKQLQERNT